MFCIKLGKKEQYKNAYRITALLGLTLSFLLLVQFIINPPTPIEAQEQPEVTVTRRGEQELLAIPSPTIEIESTESLTATLEAVAAETPAPAPAAGEEATESTEGSDFFIILLVIVIGLLIVGLVLILLRWQFKKAAAQRAARRVKAKAGFNLSKTSEPVEWNLDLEPPIPLPATWLQSPKGVPYLQSLDRSTRTIYFALTQPVSRVGRGEENELRIDESFMGWQTVSRYHAKIERDGEEFILIDTRSSNGTQVNGRYSNINLLQNDCIISFGLVQFAFRKQATTSPNELL